MTRKIFKRLFLLLIVAVMLTPVFSATGCRDGSLTEASAAENAPFYEDRVVSVYLVIAEDDWEYLKQNAMREQYVKADMWYDGELIPDIAVRPKGNSSLMSVANGNSIRFGLKVDLNFFNSARNLDGIKKLNFNNGFSDPTYIREILAYEIFEQVGVPTPRASFVDLWVNDDHLGLYTMVEQIDKSFIKRYFADENGNLYKPEQPAAYLNWTEADLGETVNVAEQENSGNTLSAVNIGGGNLQDIINALNPTDVNSDNDTVPMFPGQPGNMMPPDNINSDNTTAPGMLPQQGMGQPPQRMQPPGKFGSDNSTASTMMPPGMPPGQQGMPGMQGSMNGDLLQAMALKTNENKADYTSLFRLLEVLNNEPDETFPAEIEKILDVDEVLRFIAVSAVLVHLDNYIGQFGHNYYLYESDGRFVVIPWDMNMAFGTFNSGLDREAVIDFMIDEPTTGAVSERPLVWRLLAVPSYLEKYHQYIREIIEGPFSEKAMSARIDELEKMIYPYVEADTEKFFTTDEFVRSLTEDIQSEEKMGGGMSPIGLKVFVGERIDSIEKQLSGELPIKSTDGSGNQGDVMGNGQFSGRRNMDLNNQQVITEEK